MPKTTFTYNSDKYFKKLFLLFQAEIGEQKIDTALMADIVRKITANMAVIFGALNTVDAHELIYNISTGESFDVLMNLLSSFYIKEPKSIPDRAKVDRARFGLEQKLDRKESYDQSLKKAVEILHELCERDKDSIDRIIKRILETHLSNVSNDISSTLTVETSAKHEFR